jgi:methionyl-tRNA formyltransferase
MTESLIFAGTPANAAATLEYLVEHGFDVSLVITRPDAPFGRKRVLTPSPVAVTAGKLGLEIYKTNKIDDAANSKITETGCSTAVVVAYGALLKTPALAALSNGWFNLHYSLLPKWRGAAPVQHSILAGDRTTGVTLFKIDEGLDTGAVVASVPTQIQPGETSARLLSRLTELGCTLLSQELPAILLEQHSLTPQALGNSVTSAPKLGRDQARVDWSNGALQIERMVLAMNPEPGAWTALNGETFKIHDAREIAGAEIGAIGTVSLADGKVLVSTSAGVLELLEVQPSGKQSMPAKDWARGVSLPLRFDA